MSGLIQNENLLQKNTDNDELTIEILPIFNNEVLLDNND